MNLRSIALDAANADNEDVCKEAIQAITDPATGDDAAADCLRVFMKTKKIDAAVEMAKLIKNEKKSGTTR